MGFPPNVDAKGDISAMGLAAGQSAGLVRELMPAADVVAEIVASAEALVQTLAATTSMVRASA